MCRPSFREVTFLRDLLAYSCDESHYSRVTEVY